MTIYSGTASSLLVNFLRDVCNIQCALFIFHSICVHPRTVGRYCDQLCGRFHSVGISDAVVRHLSSVKTGSHPQGRNPMPRRGCSSVGVEHCSAWRKPNAFFGTSRRKTRRFLAGSWSNNKAVEKLWDNSSLRNNLAPEEDDHANRDGEQEPGRQVRLGGPRRKPCDFDSGGRPLAQRSQFRVNQEENVSSCDSN